MLKPVGFQNNYSKQKTGFGIRMNILPGDDIRFFDEFAKIEGHLPPRVKAIIDVTSLLCPSGKGEADTAITIVTTTKEETADKIKQMEKIAEFAENTTKRTEIDNMIKNMVKDGKRKDGKLWYSAEEALRAIKNILLLN